VSLPVCTTSWESSTGNYFIPGFSAGGFSAAVLPAKDIGIGGFSTTVVLVTVKDNWFW